MYPALQGALSVRADRYRDAYPTTGEVYLHRGDVPALGWRLQKPAWSSTFRRIVDAEISALRRGAGRVDALEAARDLFYRGFVADEIAAFAASTRVIDATGREWTGLIVADDLAAYRTHLEAPVTARYRGLDVYKCGPWTQGPVFLQQLALLEGFDLPRLGPQLAPSTSTLSSRRPSSPSPTASAGTATRRSSTCRWTGCSRRSTPAERRALIDPSAASVELRPGDVATRGAAVGHG